MIQQVLLNAIKDKLPQSPRFPDGLTPIMEDGWLEATQGGYVAYVPVAEDDDYLLELRFSRANPADRELIAAARAAWSGQ